MILEKYLIICIDFIKNILLKINNIKVLLYVIYFIIYFLFYFALTVPPIVSNNENSEKINNIGKSLVFIIIISILDFIYIVGLVTLFIYYFKNLNNLNENKILLLTLPTIIITAILIFFNMIFYSNDLLVISESKITKYIYVTISIIFYIIFFYLFIYNLNEDKNVEFYISIIILTLFFIETIIISIDNIKETYNQLSNNNFSLLSINCFNGLERFRKELFSDIESSASSQKNNQLISISQQYGDDYLKTNGNIPISFLNKNTNNYQDLILADFYYPGSYYSYLSDTPLNGTPSLDSLQISLSKFKTRIIHLDLFSSTNSQYDSTAVPVVRCNNMKEGAKSLDIDDVFRTINKWAWVTDDPNGSTYPLFLYLNINFEIDNEEICISTYNSLLKNFSKYLLDRKYGFCGRNNMQPVSKATMSECIGKIIICTNIYPTKTALDEIINASTNNLNTNFNIELYKENYVNYDKVGISQDNDKTTIINSCISNLNFYYTEPNQEYKNNSQDKAGLYNPSFQDCAQYGVQATLMYLFVPDDNLNKWVSFFENRNNFNPVLKDQSLRLVNMAKPVINKQNPVIGLQNPQKYCVVPGLISTQKSNLSGTQTNSSCKN